MNETLRGMLIANAGILLEYRDTKILVDGLYRVTDNPFSDIPPDVLRRLLDGEPPYDGVDWLLFTHRHSDHFSAELALEYARRRRPRGLLLPPGDWEAQSRLRARLAELRVPCALPGGGEERTLAPGVTVRSLLTRHLDRQYWEVPHACLLLTLGEKRVLFTADADYTLETFPGLPPLDAVFVNPLFFRALRAGRFFRGSLPAKAVCVYHIPFPEDDRGRMRPALKRDVERWPPERGRVVLFTEPGRWEEL